MLFLYLLFELGLINGNNNSYFEIFENGIISIPKYGIFLSIFESKSIDLVNSVGLHQLIDLDPFSLEIDNGTKSLRVYLFSRNKKDQLKRIKQSIPLLEAIFPKLLLMTPINSKKLLTNYSIAEIASFQLIQEKESFLRPVLNLSSSNQFGGHNKLILAYNSSKKDSKKLKDGQTTQVYTLPRYNGPIGFDLIGNIISMKNENFDIGFFNKNMLPRAIIRFQLNNHNLISFDDGISYVQKILLNINGISKENVSEIVPKDEIFPSDTEIKPEMSLISKNNDDHNPICLELCNIYNNFEIAEKSKSILCEKRIAFCSKLVRNSNFISLLMRLARRGDDKKKSKILNDLLIHLSFNQLYCLIAQFIFTYHGKDLETISLQLLHSLINEKSKSELHQSRAEEDFQKSIQAEQTVDSETNMTI